MDEIQKPKSPSGAAKRKAKRGREIEEHLAALKALGWRPSAGTDATADDGAAAFADLGPPPLEDPETLMAWARSYQAIALHVAATKPLSDPLRERIRLVRDLAATIGMTQNRAEVEERLGSVEALIANVRPHGAVKTIEASGHARAATSRGGVAARRLRPVPGHAPGPVGVPPDGRSPEAPDG